MSIQNIGSSPGTTGVGASQNRSPLPNNVVHKTADGTDAATKSSVSADQTAEKAGSAESQKIELNDALKKLNTFVSTSASDLEFTIDKDTDMPVVKVIDRQTKETIRQFPTEEALHIAKILDQFQGLLVRDKA